MIKVKVLSYIKIVFCAILLAFSYVLFIVPNKFAPAGLNGIATMIQYKFKFSIGYFSLIINIPLCILAYFFINKDFAVKSFVFVVTYSLFYLFLQTLDLTAIQYNAYQDSEFGIDTIFPCLLAGIISGFVYGISFNVNSSTGGTDIVAKWINKKNPLLEFFWVMFTLNAIVAFVSLFVYGIDDNGVFALDYKPVCLCVLYCFVSSFMGNRILQGYKTAYKFIIVSKNIDEIESQIINQLHHSATRISGEGIFSNEHKEVLLCVVNKHQIVDFKNILKSYPDTFAVIETVNETLGNFKKIK